MVEPLEQLADASSAEEHGLVMRILRWGYDHRRDISDSGEMVFQFGIIAAGAYVGHRLGGHIHWYDGAIVAAMLVTAWHEPGYGSGETGTDTQTPQ